ncbi:MAG TPA: ABC transporter permease [Solirubrobacteraceae bacterium]|nr:ABC transporter permease [Solirubrobacteraceae bacterium]
MSNVIESAVPPRSLIVIVPPRKWAPVNLKDLWAARELIGFLTWRDIAVRYKQTALGASWAVIQPLLTMIVFSVFFGNLAKISTGADVPYPVFSYAGLLAWQFFAYSVNGAGNCLVLNQNLVTKVYFPRLVLPISAVLAGLLDLFVAGLVFIPLMLIYSVVPGWAIVTLPFFVLLAIVTCLGTGFLLSSLSVTYRDVAYVIPFLLQFGIFITPIAFPASLVPDPWQVLLGLNPMAGVVEGFRWALIGGYPAPNAAMLALSVVSALFLFVLGIFYFRRTENSFADRI